MVRISGGNVHSVNRSSAEEMGPNRELNDLREILSVFESLGGVFSETVSTTGLPVGKLRNSKWRPKWPTHATDFLTS